MAAGLLAQTMGLVNKRFQYGLGISQFVLVFTIRAERVRTGRVQLDPIRTMRNLVAYGCARFLFVTHHGTRQGVFRNVRILRLGSPNDSTGGNQIPGAVDTS